MIPDHAMKFLGMIVETRWDKNVPFRRIELSRDGIEFPGGLFRHRQVRRWSDVTLVTLERIRNPFNRRQIIWFYGRDAGLEWKTGFIPTRPQRLLKALHDLDISVDVEPSTGKSSILSDIRYSLAKPQWAFLTLLVIGINAVDVFRDFVRDGDLAGTLRAFTVVFVAVLVIANALGAFGQRHR